MERQARRGGPITIGALSAKTAEDKTDYVTEQARTPRLERRLGRADLRAVPEARRALRELLGRWGENGQSDVAELLTSELVTNAIVHTDHEAVLTATVGPRGLRVEVRDFVARRPRLRLPATDEGTNGRGLFLVQSLADDWGVRAHGVGKSVWFELGAEAA
ncbi:ATP-binding protein [Streptomyces sp. NPDC019990]|uniref:ATP-binding protein n=1 Tax=Streptomyces sp. NPDC019990 TaxID=3154693 RepID=UPI0033C46EF0